MGTDIFARCEIKRKNKWELNDNEVFPYYDEAKRVSQPEIWRNYNLFAILADVRNGYGFAGLKTGDRLNPIAEPKGLPSDCSPEVREQLDWGHSTSYFTLKELVAYDWQQIHKNFGCISYEDYDEMIKFNEYPDCYSADISGKDIIVIDEENYPLSEFEDGKHYFVRGYLLPQTYYDETSWFHKNIIENMIAIADKEKIDYNDIRLVFTFDC